jgi:hypothetical protein
MARTSFFANPSMSMTGFSRDMQKAPERQRKNVPDCQKTGTGLHNGKEDRVKETREGHLSR